MLARASMENIRPLDDRIAVKSIQASDSPVGQLSIPDHLSAGRLIEQPRVTVLDLPINRQTEKDNTRRDELILEHLPLVTTIAAHVQRSLPVHTELSDLVHAGVMGHGLVRRFEAIVRNSQNCGVDRCFVLIKDLDDVAVGLGVQNLEYISAGGQHTPTGEVHPS